MQGPAGGIVGPEDIGADESAKGLNDEDGPRTPMREMRNDRILHRDRDLARRKQNSEWADKSRVTGFHTH